MHELGLAQDLWKIIKKKAAENGLRTITKITVIIGASSGIEDGFLRHSFQDHLLPGTLAEKAKLEIIKEELKMKCVSCNKEISSGSDIAFACPGCGQTNLEIVSGNDIYVHSIEGK